MPRRSGIPCGRLPWRPAAFSRLVVYLLAWGPVLAQAEIPGAQASGRRDVAIQPTALAGATSLYANSWAVVIGINEFQNPKVSRLNYAVNDANSVTQVLQALGFPEANIIKLLNRQATRPEIERILLSVLRRRAGPQDRVVVFFATHGVTLPLPSGGEEGYLLCHAATERRPTSDLGSGWCHSEIARPRGGKDARDPGRLSCGGPHPSPDYS